jgi:hypothetical protein
MIYAVREVNWDSCVHLALVEGPKIPRKEAVETFRGLYREFQAKRKAANATFNEAFGWYDKPLQGLTPENYHERWRAELRKAGCWDFVEFLEARGYRRIEHIDVSIPEIDEPSTEKEPTCPTS